MAKLKRREVGYVLQAKKIQKDYPEGKITFRKNGFIWRNQISPTPMSVNYEIKLEYKLDFQPNVYVITKLTLAKGKKGLPHVYDQKKQHLCLYHRPSGQWKSTMFIADTIIPWTYEWFYFYEYWLIDGNWYGGGIGHEKKKPFLKAGSE